MPSQTKVSVAPTPPEGFAWRRRASIHRGVYHACDKQYGFSLCDRVKYSTDDSKPIESIVDPRAFGVCGKCAARVKSLAKGTKFEAYALSLGDSRLLARISAK